ncbi:MAG: PaaD-like zinc ribbon domain-containing protein [Candidatus Thorarchaeota archaeon]
MKSRLKCPRCGSEEIGREMHPGSFGIRARFVYSCKKCRNQWEE